MAPRVFIIADDLTGACDSAAAFAMRGLRTRIALTPDAMAAALADPAQQVISVVTGTREGTRRHAEAAMAAIAAILGDAPGLVFKKIDSRMKGHIAAELAVLHAARPLPVLACPAIPRLGRLVRGGGVTGAGVSRALPVRAALGLDADIPEAGSDADIDDALPGELDARLYVGAAGLAEALARRLVPNPPAPVIAPPRLPVLMAIGSRDPVTLAQIDRLGRTPFPAPNGWVPPVAPDDIRIVQVVPGAAAEASTTIAARFAGDIAATLEADPVATLFACGGETAHAILRDLGVAQMDLAGEVLPGVPLGRCTDTGLQIVTKSGGFGGSDLLVDLLARFAGPGVETGGMADE